MDLCLFVYLLFFFFFFFQAEDGIRDGRVTGVQTCALPIYDPPTVRNHDGNPANLPREPGRATRSRAWPRLQRPGGCVCLLDGSPDRRRSEERRVGKGGRRWRRREAWKEKGEDSESRGWTTQ